MKVERQGGTRRVLLVSTHVAGRSLYRSVSEDLGARLHAAGWKVTMTSPVAGRLARLADILITTWRQRHDYDVAQVDVFSGNAFVWAEAVCTLLRRLGKPYVLTLRGGNLPVFARRWPGRVRRLLRGAGVVTAPSRYLQEEMAPYREGVRLLPNPLDLGAYPFRLREHAAPRLVWLRAFHQIYNPTLAPEVVARLRPDFPGLRLVMVGPDKDGSLARTKARAEALGVLDAIDFPGGVPKSEVPAWLQRGDVFLNTTDVDNTPVSVLEAMACGLPVVSTNVGGLPYLLDHGRDALLVPPAEADAMAAALRRVLCEGGVAARLSKAGREKVETMSWERVLPAWEDLLSKVAARFGKYSTGSDLRTSPANRGGAAVGPTHPISSRMSS